MAQQAHDRTQEDKNHTGCQTKDDRHNCSVQAEEVAGKNRHVGNSRLVAQHRSVGQEEAGREGAGSCHQEEEDSRWDRRLGMQNSYLWIVGLGEAGSGWCCKPDVGLE